MQAKCGKFINKMFSTLLENRCPPPPNVANSVGNGSTVDYGNSFVYHCLPGHYFSNVSTVKQVKCLDLEVWSQNLGDCERKYSD